MRCRLLVPALLVTALPLAARAAPATTAREAEVWMCHSNPLALIEEGARWDFVKRHLDVLKLYIDWVNKCPPDRLAALVKVLDANSIRVAIECGGTLDFAPLDDTNGERSAEIELAKMAKLTQAGGKLSYLDLDGPVRRLLHPGSGRQGFTSVDRCVAELIDYLRAVRAVYPDVRFFALTNFPNWGYKGDVSYHARGPNRDDWGDYFPVIETIVRETKKAGIPISGITVDNPYDYAIGEHFSVKLPDPRKVDWLARIRDLEGYAAQQKLDFNLIVNCERAGKQSDEAFYNEALQFVDAYRKAGGAPARYIVQSWYPYPKAVVPEDDAHTMTALVKAVIERVKRLPEGR